MLFISCIIILSIYGLFILLALVGWLIPNKTPGGWQLKDKPTFIIPFRNEERNLPGLIQALNKQTLRARVLFIDDGSTDASVSKIGLDAYEVILNSGEGKKAANATGIDMARSSLLIFTDADCEFDKEFVKNMSEQFAYTNADFAYGPVLNSIKNNSFLKSIFFLDQLSLNAVALGTGKLNMHLYCSGANIAGKRQILIKATESLKQTTNLSGDDLTLLNFCRHEEKKIIALTDKKFAVTTNSPTTLGEFFRQRLRWGQKTGFNSNLLLILLSLSVLLSSGVVILSLIASLSESCHESWYLLPLSKLLIDLLFLFLVSYRLGVLRHLWFFIPAWIFNTLYIPFIGLTGLFYSGKWKGRKIRI